MTTQTIDHIVIGIMTIGTLIAVLVIALLHTVHPTSDAGPPEWLFGLLGVSWGYYFGRNGNGIVQSIARALSIGSDTSK